MYYLLVHATRERESGGCRYSAGNGGEPAWSEVNEQGTEVAGGQCRDSSSQGRTQPTDSREVCVAPCRKTNNLSRVVLCRECSTAVDGTTYLVEGPLETPSGRRPRLRTIWLVETSKFAPRFITAYPLSA